MCNSAFKHTTPPPRDWNLAFAHAKAFPRVSDGRDGRSHPRVSVHARKPPGVETCNNLRATPRLCRNRIQTDACVELALARVASEALVSLRFRGVYACINAVLSRCFCSVTQTLRLRGVYVWMRFRGVCVWLCCAFVAVFVFGYAALSRWLGALCFRGVFVGARCVFAVCSGPMAICLS